MDIKKLYNDKLNQFGETDFRSLNWGDEKGKSAEKRYEQMSQYVDFNKSSVLEIGCGWGSFFDFGYKCKDYIGLDINENLLNIARKKYSNKKWLLNKSLICEWAFVEMGIEKYDICISSGVAGNRGGPAWNPSLLKGYLKTAYTFSKISLINFPSNRATIRSEYVEYFSPEYVISEALNITNNIQLIHQDNNDFLLILTNE
tara:strand:- start:3450 stop:4052 length:603 start_codon:yes stop_codon:yes gene_type:complete